MHRLPVRWSCSSFLSFARPVLPFPSLPFPHACSTPRTSPTLPFFLLSFTHLAQAVAELSFLPSFPSLPPYLHSPFRFGNAPHALLLSSARVTSPAPAPRVRSSPPAFSGAHVDTALRITRVHPPTASRILGVPARQLPLHARSASSSSCILRPHSSCRLRSLRRQTSPCRDIPHVISPSSV